MGIELCEPGAIEILKIGIGAGERQIDVVDALRRQSLQVCLALPA